MASSAISETLRAFASLAGLDDFHPAVVLIARGIVPRQMPLLIGGQTVRAQAGLRKRRDLAREFQGSFSALPESVSRLASPYAALPRLKPACP